MASTPVWYREPPEEESAVTAQERQERAPAAQPSGAGGAGAGASGLCNPPWAWVLPFHLTILPSPCIGGIEHLTSPLSSNVLYGVPSLQLNTAQVNALYSRLFPPALQFLLSSITIARLRTVPLIFLSPALNSYYRFTFQQQLLAGFGFGPNLRYLRIAKNNKKISDIAFKDQVIATVTQIENIYWDLVSAYEQARVNEQSLAFATRLWKTPGNNCSWKAFRRWT